jgi:hypothetical protein
MLLSQSQGGSALVGPEALLVAQLAVMRLLAHSRTVSLPGHAADALAGVVTVAPEAGLPLTAKATAASALANDVLHDRAFMLTCSRRNCRARLATTAAACAD